MRDLIARAAPADRRLEALPLRDARMHDAIEHIDFIVGERRGLRNGRG